MKRITALIAVLLTASPVWADPIFYQPPTPIAQVAVTPGRVINGYAGDEYGRQKVLIEGVTGAAAPTPAAAEITPNAMVTVLPTALPTAFSTPFLVSATGLKSFSVDNSSGDVEVWCAPNGSTTLIFAVPPGGVYTDNLATRGQKLSGGISCIHPANTPATGALRAYGE